MTNNTPKHEQVESLYNAALANIRSARDTLKAARDIALDEDRKDLASAILVLADEIQRAGFTGFDDDVQNALDTWSTDVVQAELPK